MPSLLHLAEKHGDPHKLLLQLLMARGGIRISKIVEVFQKLCNTCLLVTEIPDECTPEVLSETLIQCINPVIKTLDLSVGISTSYSVSDEKFLVMYSTSTFTKSSKLLFFSDQEQRIFQTYITIMFVENPLKLRGELDGIAALNAGLEFSFRPLQAESFLNKLVKDNIFRKLKDFDSYIFTPRAVMELEPRLRGSEYQIPSCPICSNLVLVRRFSHHCFICNTVIHSTCLKKMINLSTNVVACPGEIDENIRCTNKYEMETLDSLVFDTPAPENKNRPVEIVGVRGGTQVPENSDQEMNEKYNDANGTVLKEESFQKSDEESEQEDESNANYQLQEDDEEFVATNAQHRDDEEQNDDQIMGDNETKYVAEDNDIDDEQETEEHDAEEPYDQNEDQGDNQMEEFEENFADVDSSGSNPAKISSIQRQIKDKKKDACNSVVQKYGDALDDLFDELEELEEGEVEGEEVEEDEEVEEGEEVEQGVEEGEEDEDYKDDKEG